MNSEPFQHNALPDLILRSRLQLLLGKRRDFAALVGRILEYRLNSGVFDGARVTFEYMNWPSAPQTWVLQLSRIAGTADSVVVRSFKWDAAGLYEEHAFYRKGTKDLTPRSFDKKDQPIAQATLCEIYDNLSAVRGFSPAMFTDTPL